MLTKAFWLGERGVLVRAIRTAAQTAIAAIGVGQTNLLTVDMKNVAALSLSSAVLSILMSLDRNSENGGTTSVVYEPQAAIPASSGAEMAPAPATANEPPAENLRGTFGFASPGCGESLR